MFLYLLHPILWIKGLGENKRWLKKCKVMIAKWDTMIFFNNRDKTKTCHPERHGKGYQWFLLFRTILGSGLLFLQKLPMLPFQEAVSILNSNWQLSYDHIWQPDYETAEGGLVPAFSMQNICRCSLYLWDGRTNITDQQICLELSAVRQSWNQIFVWINWKGLGTLGWETPHWGLY